MSAGDGPTPQQGPMHFIPARPTEPMNFKLPPEVEAAIGDTKPTVHLITGPNGMCLCGQYGDKTHVCSELLLESLYATRTAIASAAEKPKVYRDALPGDIDVDLPATESVSIGSKSVVPDSAGDGPTDTPLVTAIMVFQDELENYPRGPFLLLAQQLERENTALRQRLADAEAKRVESIRNLCARVDELSKDLIEAHDEIESVTVQLAAAESREAALRKAVEDLLPHVLRDYDPDCASPKFKAALEACRALREDQRP